MDEQVELQLTKKQSGKELVDSVKKLFNTLKIKKIINVDDLHGVSKEALIAKAISLSIENLSIVFPDHAEQIAEINDKEISLGIIRSAVDNFTRKECSQAYTSILSIEGQPEAKIDFENISALDEFIPEGISLLKLSLEEWHQKKDQLIRESKDEERILFLFDHDFGNGEYGIRIISEISSDPSSAGLVFGLLTHTATIDTVKKRWHELSQEPGIDKDRLIVVSKSFIRQRPELLVQSFKYIALCPDFKKLKDKTEEIIKTATSIASKKVAEVDIHTLDHLIFRLPRLEGIWEPEMLFRLYSLFQNIETRKALQEDHSAEIVEITNRLRDLNDIPVEYDDSFVLMATEVYHQELYENGDYLNRIHSPLELGDIFEHTASSVKKKYILIGQPCSLMVRPLKGEREPELTHALLAEISSTNEKKISPFWFDLNCFEMDNPDARWYVELNRTNVVNIEILDLCVFNKDGASKICNIESTKPPANLRLPWQKYFSDLKEKYKKKIDLFIRIRDSIQNAADKKSFMRSFFQDTVFNGKLVPIKKGNSLEFDCRRVGRLSKERALGLLQTYTAIAGRPAFDLYLGEKPKGKDDTN